MWVVPEKKTDLDEIKLGVTLAPTGANALVSGLLEIIET